MRAPKLRELKEAVTAIIKGPYTARFPAEPTPLPEAFRGRPRLDKEQCVACGACCNVCPAGALEKLDEPQTRTCRIVQRLDRCIFCGQCEANCLTKKGIKLTREYDLATTNRAELRDEVSQPLVLCEACSAVIGAEPHLRWVARRIGPLAFANPTLLLTVMMDLGLADKEPQPSDALRRGDRIRVLCPKCRQETSFVA